MTTANSSINRQRRAALATENVTTDIYPLYNDEDLEEEYGLRPASVPARATNAYRQRNNSGPGQNFRPANYSKDYHNTSKETEYLPAHKNPDAKTVVFKKERRVHWLVPVGATLLVIVVGWWFAGTIGATFMLQHFTSDNGPTHGSIVTFTAKPGAQPEQLIAVNNAGKVDIFLIPTDTKNTKIYEGIDLIQANFPQATSAIVTLTVRDLNHDGNEDVVVQILSNVFTEPFHRPTETYLLIGDGKGNLIQQQAALAG